MISGLPWYFQNWMTWQGKGFGDEFNPLSCLWRYNRPTLYVEYVGTFSVWVAYKRPLPRIGSIGGVSIVQPGSSYNIGDTLTVNGGNNDATLTVTSVNSNGGVSSVIITTGGTGYWQDTMYSTTVTPVGGSSCRVKVSSLSSTPPPYYDLPDITIEDRRFLKLTQGRFMQALGRSRKSFILNDMPVISDAVDMVETGKEIEREALTELQEYGKWYMSMA